MPPEVTADGFEYFLEVSVINEVLRLLDGKGATDDKKLALVMHYAQFDAYPAWAYEDQ
jgi:hypothetical protein